MTSSRSVTEDRDKRPVSGNGVLLATILGSSMAFIDGTAVNVALPVMQRDLHASMADIQWVVEAFSLFLAALILVGGALGDRYGRKLIFVVGTALFTVSSIACALSHGIVAIAVARSVQGIGSALMAPASLAILSATFEGDARAKAIGTWSAATAVTAAVGPALGGWLVDHGGWQWIFYINAPIGAAVIFLTLAFVPESRNEEERGKNLDWLGAGLATIGLGAITYGLILSGSPGANAGGAIAWSVTGAVLLLVFVLSERIALNPLMPLKLFRSRVFSGVNLVTFLLYGALSEALYFVSFDMIQVHRYTPTQAGLAMMPFIVLIASLSRWAGGLVAKVGVRSMLVVGPTIAAIGYALFSLAGTDGPYWTTFLPGSVVVGLGMAVTVAPLTNAVMSAVDESHLGIASGINNAVSRVAGLIAIAAMSAIVVAIYVGQLDQRLSAIHASADVVRQVRAQSGAMAAAQIPASASVAVRNQVRGAMDDSFAFSFQIAVLIGAGLAAGSALIALFTIGDTRRTVKVRPTESQ
jgi:EmrB/QacA subfamily drug resistance transporter